MYQVIVETYGKKDEELIEQVCVSFEDIEEDVRRLENVLYGLEIEFDDIEGDGDMIIDDMLMNASEEDEFEEMIEGKNYNYRIVGLDR